MNIPIELLTNEITNDEHGPRCPGTKRGHLMLVPCTDHRKRHWCYLFDRDVIDDGTVRRILEEMPWRAEEHPDIIKLTPEQAIMLAKSLGMRLPDLRFPDAP